MGNSTYAELKKPVIVKHLARNSSKTVKAKSENGSSLYMKRQKMVSIITFAITIIVLTGCSDSTVILKNRNFSDGDWLLVNDNGANQTLFVIDDETILQENPDGIKVNFSEDDHYTTCDGILKLYKDGKLVAEQMYLDQSSISESNNIKEAYKKATDDSVYPYDSDDFHKQWDSITKLPDQYPNRLPHAT